MSYLKTGPAQKLLSLLRPTGQKLLPKVLSGEKVKKNSERDNCGIDSIETQDKNNAMTSDSESEFVTYVIVVHGIGEQRKNETVISVVNRFAEARRDPIKKEDN